MQGMDAGQEDKGKRVAIHTLGCKVNSYESEVMLQSFRARGYEIVPFEQAADIYVVNTCTVTQIADKKSRQMIHRARKRNPRAVVVAVGCYVETGAVALRGDGAADLIVGNLEKPQIVELVEDYRETGRCREPRLMPRQEAPCASFGASLEGAPILRTRAFLRIQDGCDQFCSYCVIPYARGRSRSRDAGDILEEARRLAAQGVGELVLTGIHLSSYGAAGPAWGRGDPAEASPLFDLIRRLQEIPGVARIRLGSLEPRLITASAAEVLGELTDPARGGKLCPHFHLSLQSGCDEVLRRMNRHYTARRYAESVGWLREAIDRPAVTADVIAGFPGETEAEFEETRRFLEAQELYEVHVFPYSRRAGTIACALPGQIPRAERERRSAVLLSLTAAQARAYRGQFLGEELRVLWEEVEELEGARYLTGHTERYVKAALPLGAEEEALRGRVTGAEARGFLRDDVLLCVAIQS